LTPLRSGKGTWKVYKPFYQPILHEVKLPKQQNSKTNNKRAKPSDSVKAINSRIIKVSKRFQGDKRAI
jgi:ribosomal protein S16